MRMVNGSITYLTRQLAVNALSLTRQQTKVYQVDVTSGIEYL